MSRLTALQQRVLVVLARNLTAPWVLTGGAALGGFYTMHRSTRDLDITPGDRRTLGNLPGEVHRCLVEDGLRVELHRVQREHCQLTVSDGHESVLVELVAGWSPPSDAPRILRLGDQSIHVEAQHELLVRKLMALFDRSEPRDLDDVRA